MKKQRETPNPLGTMIQSRRVGQGWTQVELGRFFGVVGNTVSKWERSGAVGPDHLERVSAWLEIESREALRLSGRQVPMTQEELRADFIAQRAARGLPPTIQDPVVIARVAPLLRKLMDQYNEHMREQGESSLDW